MVALLTYLFASAALSNLGFAFPLSVRSPNPNPASNSQDSTNSFASIIGPVVDSNFPDPAIIHQNGISYAFATNNRGVGPAMIHVQVATSTDNTTWTIVPGYDALPTIGAWETGARVWAPDVIELTDGSFVMYYTDEVVSSPAHHCIGAATSKTIMGPYEPLKDVFACPNVVTQGGAIDPDGFLDESSGKRYVTYKVDGNSIGHGGLCMNSVAPIVPTPILLQEVDAEDGVTLIGGPIEILDRDDLDGPLIEAPSLHRSDEGIYFLFYSSGCFSTSSYDTAYATASNINGPYTKSSRPLFVTGDGPDLVGPGGTDIIKGGSTIVFHGHITSQNINQKKRDNTLVRGMYTAIPTFLGTTVSLAYAD